MVGLHLNQENLAVQVVEVQDQDNLAGLEHNQVKVAIQEHTDLETQAAVQTVMLVAEAEALEVAVLLQMMATEDQAAQVEHTIFQVQL